MFEKIFKLKENNTTVKVEIIAGITTFLTMAYILGVNAGILSMAGMPPTAVFFATAVASAVACFLMGFIANYPVALSAGMGVNAFFTFTVVFGYGYTWQEALALVFISGLIFLVISYTGVRKAIINAIPYGLKQAIGAGIGFFIAFIGLTKAGIIVSDPNTKVALSSFANPTILLGIFGILLTIFLMSKGINAAIFFGLIATGIIGIVLSLFGISGMPQLPSSVVSLSFDTSTFGSVFSGFSSLFANHSLVEIFILTFTFLFVDFFDTTGTLLAISNKLGWTKENGEIEGIEKALVADSIGTVIGSVFGTSTITSFVESTSGVAAGGRTGLTAVVVGICFLLATLFSPLLAVIGAIPTEVMIAGAPVTLILEPVLAPALVCVGILMATQLSNVDWHDFTAAASGFTTIIVMLLSYSIASGIAAGFIVYTLTMIARNKSKEISGIVWVLTIIFILHFAL